jgi:hypothetical protein
MDHEETEVEAVIDALSSRDASRNLNGVFTLLKFQSRAKDINHFMAALIVCCTGTHSSQRQKMVTRSRDPQVRIFTYYLLKNVSLSLDEW